MSQLVDTQRSLLFRRQRFVARHRKRPVWLRLWRPFAQAMLLVGAPTMLAYWVLTAPQFTLRAVEINRLPHIDPVWVEHSLETYRGRPLVSMPMRTVERALSAHPWVASVRVNKQLPDRLQVEITEKAPAFVLREADGAAFVDATGEPIAPYSDRSPWRDLPVVEGSAEASVLATAADVRRRMTEVKAAWGDAITHVEALNDQDFVVESELLPFALIVSAPRVDEQMTALATYLGPIRRAYPDIERVDLRVAESIVVKPANAKKEE